MSAPEITRAVAEKVLAVVDAGLVRGVGKPVPGSMCVEAAVCYALGLPHGDDPQCVSRALRALKIRLNDSPWSSDEARARGLRRLALVQLGSVGALDDREFVRRVAEMTIRTVVPEALRAAATRCKDEGRKATLLSAADRCEREGTRESALEAKKAAADADVAAAAYAAAAAAYAYADADVAAAYADAAAAYAYADAAAYAASRDRLLAGFAERVVQILIDMAVPGVQWLDLAPPESP